MIQTFLNYNKNKPWGPAVTPSKMYALLHGKTLTTIIYLHSFNAPPTFPCCCALQPIVTHILCDVMRCISEMLQVKFWLHCGVLTEPPQHSTF